MYKLKTSLNNFQKRIVLAFKICYFSDVLSKRHGHKKGDGKDGGKIVGGTETTIESYPYQAYLLLYDGRDYYQCGGSIVNRYYIITAAHCLTR